MNDAPTGTVGPDLELVAASLRDVVRAMEEFARRFAEATRSNAKSVAVMRRQYESEIVRSNR